MANLKYLGETQLVSVIQLNFIGAILEKEGFKNNEVYFEAVGKPGDIFFTNVKRLIVKTEGKPFKMIAKLGKVSRLNLSEMFSNESIMYSEIFPTFQELEGIANVPDNERFIFPKCYGISRKDNHQVILLEDLEESNYVILDRFKLLHSEVIKSVLKSLAKFHALSFIFKLKQPETFIYYEKRLFSILSNLSGHSAKYFKHIEMTTSDVLRDTKKAELIKVANVGNYSQMLSDMTRMNSETKYTIISHGDPWTNNILFKVEKENICKATFVDYQHSQSSSPVFDLMYFIFNCTDHQARSDLFHYWINYYYDELDKALSYHNRKADIVYPKPQLYNEIRQYGKLMLARSIIHTHMTVIKPEDAVKIKNYLEDPNHEICDLSAESKTLYHNRLDEIVESFIKFKIM